MHQSEVEFDEEGTVAKAITGGFGAGGFAKEESQFYAEHPFLYLIMDQASGAILFMGRHVEPDENTTYTLEGEEILPPAAGVDPPRGVRDQGGFF